MDIWRGDIVKIDLGDSVGSVQGGYRPAAIVQNDVGNKYSPTTLVVPLTGSTSKKYLPTHVEIKVGTVPGLTKDSLVLCEQHFTISKDLIKEKLGKLTNEQLARVNVALGISMGIGVAS